MRLNIQVLKSSLSNVLGLRSDFQLQPCCGGDTHHSFQLRTNPSATGKVESYFIKVNSLSQASILESEAASLHAVNALFPDGYPNIIDYRTTDEHSILVMSFHQLETTTARTAADLGNLLAKQHTIQNSQCGWHCDNYIGSSPQINAWANSWPEFFLVKRLLPQLSMAIKNNLPSAISEAIKNLTQSPPQELTIHKPEFALLHGDLWFGNMAYDSANTRPLLFDPAPYFGDPEVDIAMTQMFGGFPPEFYTAYYRVRPRQRGHEIRQELYNLYHSLNHFNIFGDNYLPNIEQNLRRLNIGWQAV